MLVAVASCASAFPFADEGSSEYEYPDLTTDERMNMMRGEQSLLPPAITYNKVMQPLEFWEKVKKKPRGKHTKASRLIKKMGGDFQPTWM